MHKNKYESRVFVEYDVYMEDRGPQTEIEGLKHLILLTELQVIRSFVTGSSTIFHSFPKKAGTLAPISAIECIFAKKFNEFKDCPGHTHSSSAPQIQLLTHAQFPLCKK